MAACTRSAGHLVGRYRSDRNIQFPGGCFDVTFAPPNTFAGVYTADDPSFPGQFAYTGTFERHFLGDGSEGQITEGTLGAISGKVEVQLGSSPWQPAAAGMKLKVGDRVHLGPGWQALRLRRQDRLLDR
jgi:hypothetical protein